MPAFDDIFVRREAEELRRDSESIDPARALPGDDAPRYLPSGTVRPWVRFWARNLDDMFLLFASVAVLWALQSMGVPRVSLRAFFETWVWFLYPPWVFGEAWFLSRWGATPGKALLNVRVTGHDGGRLSYGTAFRRAVSVFVMGLGCRLPFLVFLTQAFSFVLLKRTGRTHWDRGLDTRVEHGPVGWSRVALSVGIVLFLMLLLERPMEEALAPFWADMDKVMTEWRNALQVGRPGEPAA
jgi:uncharacterized RDD family membrane protein YckC